MSKLHCPSCDDGFMKWDGDVEKTELDNLAMRCSECKAWYANMGVWQRAMSHRHGLHDRRTVEYTMYRNDEFMYLIDKRGSWGHIVSNVTSNPFEALFSCPSHSTIKMAEGFKPVKINLTMIAEEITDE